MLWHFITTVLLPCFPFLGMLWSPCCCGGGCQFFSDDFAVDDLATNYTSVSGSWAISGGNLHTASSSAVLTGSTANPNSDSNTKVSVTVNIATDGDTARIILNYQNSSNYWFAEVKAGSGAYLRIYQRSGGSNTQKATNSISLAISTPITFCAAIVNGSVIVTSYDDGSNFGSAGFDGTFSNTGWGLGTGTLAGTVTFDDLSVLVTGTAGTDTCPACAVQCSGGHCTGDLSVAAYKIVISGWANGTCTDCANQDGTYYVPAGSGGCSGSSNAIITLCAFSPTTLTTTWNFTAGNFLNQTGGSGLVMNLSGSAPYNCQTFNNRSLVFSSGGGASCVATSVTAHVTSIV